MRSHSFAYVTFLASYAAAAGLQAQREMAQMQMCISRIDFSHPNAMREVDNCAVTAKSSHLHAKQQTYSKRGGGPEDINGPSVDNQGGQQQVTDGDQQEACEFSIENLTSNKEHYMSEDGSKEWALSEQDFFKGDCRDATYVLEDAESWMSLEDDTQPTITIDTDAAVPGNYNFKIVAITSENDASSLETSLEIQIEPNVGKECTEKVEGWMQAVVTQHTYTIGSGQGSSYTLPAFSQDLTDACNGVEPTFTLLIPGSLAELVSLAGTTVSWEDDSSEAQEVEFEIKVMHSEIDVDPIAFTLTLNAAQVQEDEEEVAKEFDFAVTSGGITASVDDTDMLAFEVDFSLTSSTECLEKDDWVFMYTQLKGKGELTEDDDTWETVTCLVQYNQVDETGEKTEADIKERAIVSSYLGDLAFDEISVSPQKFSEFNDDEKITDAIWRWGVNILEPTGFNQLYVPKDADDADAVDFTAVTCATTSSRTSPPSKHDYKIGDTIKMRSGYKVRSQKTDTQDVFSFDGVEQDFTIAAVEANAMSLYAGAITMTLASMLAF